MTCRVEAPRRDEGVWGASMVATRRVRPRHAARDGCGCCAAQTNGDCTLEREGFKETTCEKSHTVRNPRNRDGTVSSLVWPRVRAELVDKRRRIRYSTYACAHTPSTFAIMSSRQSSTTPPSPDRRTRGAPPVRQSPRSTLRGTVPVAVCCAPPPVVARDGSLTQRPVSVHTLRAPSQAGRLVLHEVALVRAEHLQCYTDLREPPFSRVAGSTGRVNGHVSKTARRASRVESFAESFPER